MKKDLQREQLIIDVNKLLIRSENIIEQKLINQERKINNEFRFVRAALVMLLICLACMTAWNFRLRDTLNYVYYQLEKAR